MSSLIGIGVGIGRERRRGESSDPRMKAFVAANIEEGDMVFWDSKKRKHVIVKKAAIGAVLADYDNTRYRTNHDTVEGICDGMVHFCAITDAYSQEGMYTGDGDTAAGQNYYRFEIDNSQDGSITFSATSGNASVARTTISWEASEAMADIVARFVAKNATYITFAALADGTGVGLAIGGYGSNSITVTGEPVGCTVVDCSKLAFLRSENPTAPAVGGDFDPTAEWVFLNSSTHKSFRGSTARTILSGAYPDIVSDSTTLIAMDGYSYSYRTFINFAKGKSWASMNGESTYYDDGEDGLSGSAHVGNPGAHVMNETTFNTGVRDYVAADPDNLTTADLQHLGMKTYYTHLLAGDNGVVIGGQTMNFGPLKALYESYYGQMTTMYDAYIMSHMGNPDAETGITAMMRNKGLYQTRAKADLMNVTYNYKVVPAYAPEYNAQHYGLADCEGFLPGLYYNPEPVDMILRYRDDNLTKINQNVTAVNAAVPNTGRVLSVSEYRGSGADSVSTSGWYFNGTNGVLYGNLRYLGTFRPRPALALPLQN